MVAYSFKDRFVAPIRSGTKTQTLRGPRARHARPGETVHLYCRMRRRDCFAIPLDGHPVCTGVARVDLEPMDGTMRVVVEGVPLPPEEAEEFARRDGFGGGGAPASEEFARWWTETHGDGGSTDLTVIVWDVRGADWRPVSTGRTAPAHPPSVDEAIGTRTGGTNGT